MSVVAGPDGITYNTSPDYVERSIRGRKRTEGWEKEIEWKGKGRS